MPTVPTSFVPQVDQTANNSTAVAAPAVEPMGNAAPEQIEQLGQAVERMGLTEAQIGQHIQAKLDDANVKAAETKFITTSMDLLHGQDGYMNKQGADALNAYDPATQAIIKAKQDVLDSLGNDVQKRIFNQVASQHLATFGAQMGGHRAQQRDQYTANEALSRVDTQRVMHSQAEIGSDDARKYAASGEQEVGNYLAAKGIPADSEQAKKAVRDYRTNIVSDDVNRLMVAGKYDDAKTLLGEQSKAGNVDADAADHLRASIESNLKRVDVIAAADSIFAPYKGKPLQTTDLEAMLTKAEAIKDPEKREMVRNQVKSQFSEAHAIQEQKYRDNLNDVVNYKYENKGSLKGVDPVKWGALDAKDRYELSKPPAVESNLNTLYTFIVKPDALTVDNVKSAFTRGLLSKGDFLSLSSRAMEAQKNSNYVQEAGAIGDRIDYLANQASINVYGPSVDKAQIGTLKYRIMGDIDRIKAQNHGKATPEQVDAVIKKAVTQRTISTLRSQWTSWALGKYSTEQKYGFLMPQGATKVVPGSDGKMYYADDKNNVLGVVK